MRDRAGAASNYGPAALVLPGEAVSFQRTFLPNFVPVGASAPEARRMHGLVFGAAGRKCLAPSRVPP